MRTDQVEIRLSEAVYQIPMYDLELMALARITVMWGQLEKQMDMVLKVVLDITWEEYRSKYESRMISKKTVALRCALSNKKNKTHRKLLIEMAEAIDSCLSDRNTVTHGQLSWHYLKEKNVYRAGFRSALRQETFWLKDIFELHERIVEAAVKSDIAFYAVWKKIPAPETRNRASIVAPREVRDENGAPKISPPPREPQGWLTQDHTRR